MCRSFWMEVGESEQYKSVKIFVYKISNYSHWLCSGAGDFYLQLTFVVIQKRQSIANFLFVTMVCCLVL